MFIVFITIADVAGKFRNTVNPETKKGAASGPVIVICARPLKVRVV
jgi:hypothetical protein